MKFVMSSYTPQTADGNPEAETYPTNEEAFSTRMRDIGNGVFTTVLKEIGPLRRFGEKTDPDYFER